MLGQRLLSILLLLQTRGTLSATALAEEFEVSVRTIYRDIDQLSASGIPVYAERGRDGGFRLRDGYRTRLTGLTRQEAETLLLAGLPGPASELGLADPLATARLKLLAALPDDLQTGAERVASRFHLDPAGWFHAASRADCLPGIARAVWESRYLRVTYLREGQAHQRKLGPLGLVLKGGIWYLVAQRGKAHRTYRVSNVASADVLDETYERPVGFDLAAYWKRSSSDYEAGVYRGQADIRLSPRGRRLLELLGPHVAAGAEASAQAPDTDGWIRCTIPIESIDYATRELLRLADEVEVLGPDELRQAMAEIAHALVGRYSGRYPESDE